MSFSWSSITHVFASGLHDLKVGEAAVAAAIPKIISDLKLAEPALSTLPTVGGTAVLVDRAGEAILGSVLSLLTAGDTAAKSKLLDAGLDQDAINQAESLIKQIPTVISSAKATATTAGLLSPKVVATPPAGVTGQIS